MSSLRDGRGRLTTSSLAGLNEYSPLELSPEDNYEPDISLFTNSNFPETEFDLGDYQPPGVGIPSSDRESVAPVDIPGGSLSFSISPDEISGFDFGPYPNHAAPSFQDNLGLQLIQSNTNSAYPPLRGPPVAAISPSSRGGKRMSMSSAIGQSRPINLDDPSKAAAEEDKRRRNTAASARFRIKKKQREQALEQRGKELADENTSLRTRIDHLETENKWLRGLVMEKNGGNTKRTLTKLDAFLKSLEKDSEEEEESKSRVHVKTDDDDMDASAEV